MQFRVGDYVQFTTSILSDTEPSKGIIVGENLGRFLVKTQDSSFHLFSDLLSLDYCHPQPLQESARSLTQRQVASGRFDAPAVVTETALSDVEIEDQIIAQQQEIADMKALIKNMQDDLTDANRVLGRLRDEQWRRRNPALAAINARRG